MMTPETFEAIGQWIVTPICGVLSFYIMYKYLDS